MMFFCLSSFLPVAGSHFCFFHAVHSYFVHMPNHTAVFIAHSHAIVSFSS